MKYLVTGGAGFLGNAVCRRLVNENHEVICLDNLMTSSKENISDLFSYSNFEFIRWDVEDKITVECDVILNLACPASPKWYYKNPTKTMTTSIRGALHMLELARLHNAKILQFSTSEVLGDPEVHPQPETYNGNVSTVSPRSVYDESKRCAETFFMTYHRQFGVDTRIVRLFNSFGPRMAIGDGRVVSNFIVSAIQDKPITIFGDGSQTRSLCYFEDTIDGVLSLLNADYHYPVNIGSVREHTILEIAEIIRTLTNSKSELIFEPLPVSDPKQRRPDIALAMDLLNWYPKVSLEDGLKETIKYFESVIKTKQTK
jgi:UDP-glucuronate decarboxylase